MKDSDWQQSLSVGWQSLPQARLGWWPNFIAPCARVAIRQQLMDELQLEQGVVSVYGQRYLIPRLQAWYGEHDYRYSGESLSAQPMTELLTQLMGDCEQQAESSFNSVLVNYYRDGRDRMGWHSDDEHELGSQPVIASLSLGACRDFDLKHKESGEKLRIALSDGSLLVMAGATQHFWRHALPQRLRCKAPRLNLTFRYVHGA